MHDVVWQRDVNCVRIKYAQKQLARTSLNNLRLLLAARPHEPRPPTQKFETIIFMDIEFSEHIADFRIWTDQGEFAAITNIVLISTSDWLIETSVSQFCGPANLQNVQIWRLCKKAQKNPETGTLNLEISRICVKWK